MIQIMSNNNEVSIILKKISQYYRFMVKLKTAPKMDNIPKCRFQWFLLGLDILCFSPLWLIFQPKGVGIEVCISYYVSNVYFVILELIMVQHGTYVTDDSVPNDKLVSTVAIMSCIYNLDTQDDFSRLCSI
jgi:hypothetical protein